MNTQFIIESVLKTWQRQCGQFEKVINQLSDEDLVKEITKGKNTGKYVLGHLVAANENVLVLMGLGEKKYPELENIFIQTPDKLGQEMFDATILRKLWKETSETLTHHFLKMEVNDWFLKHSNVSEEDFIKDPSRNKLSILLTRTLHIGYHTGQLVLLVSTTKTNAEK